MPGLTNRRNAIREGTDWTKSKAKGYKYGGPVLGQSIGPAAALLPKIAKKSKKKLRRP